MNMSRRSSLGLIRLLHCFDPAAIALLNPPGIGIIKERIIFLTTLRQDAPGDDRGHYSGASSSTQPAWLEKRHADDRAATLGTKIIKRKMRQRSGKE